MKRRRESMSKVDTAWLRMERPTNLMMITSLLFFSGRVSLQRLRETLLQRLAPYERFLYKPVETPAGVVWEFDEDFDINAHVRAIGLPEPAGRKEMQDLVSDLASTPLPRGRPLWQYHLVENYEAGPVLIIRIHHCYADGMALVQVLLSMTDDRPDAAPHEEPANPQLKAYRGGVVQRILAPAQKGLDHAFGVGVRAVREAAGMVRNPGRAADLAVEGAEMAKELLVALSLGADPKTRFKADELSSHKRVAWCDPLPLEDVKLLARSLDVKVNDLLIAAATGALRSYLGRHDQPPDRRLCIRATVPVNLRPLHHSKELGNHFGLVFLDLPIGEPNPLRRVEQVHDAMQHLKESKQATVSLGLLGALGLGPAAVQAPALEFLSSKATTVLTNVPGPTKPLYLAGARIDQQMFWVPQTGNIGLGISILSYNGSVFMGIMTDARRVPDPEEIVDRFGPEFDRLMLLRLMFPEHMVPRGRDADALMAHWG